MAKKKKKAVRKKAAKKKVKRGRGRPTKLTPEVQEKIAKALAIGLTYDLASDMAGISRETLRDWINRGEREGEGIYYNFSCAIKKDIATAAGGLLATIRRAGQEQWQANAWILERRHPEAFGRTAIDVTHRGDKDNPVKIEAEIKYSPEEVAEIARLIEEMGIDMTAIEGDDAGGDED